MSKWDSLYLPIAFEYKPLFARLASSCRVLLERPDLQSCQRSMLEKLHFTLGRLPVLTMDVDFTVILANPHHDSSDAWWTYTMEIDHNSLRITNTNYAHSGNADVQSHSRLVLHCESNGNHHDEGEDGYISYVVFEGWVRGWDSLCRNPESILTIYNKRELFDWYQYHDPKAWDKMPSLFAN